MKNKNQNIRGRNKNKQDLAERLRQKLAIKKGDKKICLTMIVKNEEKNMERLLDSLIGVIDMISIVDTGSTDKTAEIINNWGKKHGLPTKVHHQEFKNFGYNRTQSLEKAKMTFRDADYFLLSDADFIWKVGDFRKMLLTDHKYLVEQDNGKIKYWNVRMLSAEVDFECLGLTHEYWNEKKHQTIYQGEVRCGKIRTLSIDDREDGGCKDDKFQRDERLLLSGINDPKTPPDLVERYTFYLAQTYKDLQKNKESIIWYKKRADGHNGYQEEVFYSYYQIGVCNERIAWRYKHSYEKFVEDNQSDVAIQFCKNENIEPTLENLCVYEHYFEEASFYYKKAHEFRPSRSESLYALTRMYRLLSRHREALDTALLGIDIPYPKQDSLFIENDPYNYLFDYEISIVAFYVPNSMHLGRDSVCKLLGRDDLPDYLTKSVTDISKFYI